MNDSSNLTGAPFGDDTDEALSALVDGELDAFARERGLTEDAARARLEAWPEAEARLAELDRARASMQVPVPELDDVTRRRLVRGASNAAPKPYAPAPRSRSWLAIAAVAAAGLLVVIGIGVAISSMGGGGESKSSQSAATGAAVRSPLRGDVGDLGDVTSVAALRALLDRREAAAGASKRSAGNASDAAPEPERSVAGAAGTAPPGADTRTVDPRRCAFELAGSRDVTFSGTGTSRGAPVAILGVGEGGRTIVFVVSSTDCTKVLASISR